MKPRAVYFDGQWRIMYLDALSQPQMEAAPSLEGALFLLQVNYLLNNVRTK